MSKMCAMSGCKAKQGMCIHEKMMFGGGLMMMAAAIFHWGFHLI